MLDYDPFSDEVINDPHPVYRRLRDESPAHYLEQYDCWALSRFEDIWQASMDPVHYSNLRGVAGDQMITKMLPIQPSLAVQDPPLHTHIRGAVAGYFTPRAVARLEGTFRGWAKELVDRVIDRGHVDAVEDLGTPMAVRVACRVIGFPQEDSEFLIDVVKRFFSRVDGFKGMTKAGLEASREMHAYLLDLVATRRRQPARHDDVIEAFCNVEVDGERMPAEILASHLALMVVGSTETFPKVLATTLRRLAEHPDQRRRLVDDPSGIPDAVNEGARYDMPTQFLCRSLHTDVELHGQQMRAGQGILFLYAAANRDPREFPDPDRFDVERRAPRILSFGHGVHRCLGVHTARMEGKVMLEQVLARMPDYEVDLQRAERLRTEFVQGFASLPIHFQSA